VKFPAALLTYAERRPYASPQFFSAYVIEYGVFAASVAIPCEAFAPTMRPMFFGSLMLPGNAVVKASLAGFVQTVGATPFSHFVKLFEVPEPSARKTTLIGLLGSV